MSSPRHDPIDRFDEALDALGRGEPVAPDPADPTLLPAVTRLRALDRTQRPDPRLADRIWADLMREARLADVPLRSPAGPADPVPLNGHAAPYPWRADDFEPPRPAHRRRLPAQLAAAAVLALVLVGSLIATRHIVQDRDAALNVLDAAHRPAVETLVDAAVENPAASWTALVVERWTFPSGTSTLSIPPLDGPQWIVAEGWGLVVTRDGAEHRLSTGGGIVIPAGQGVVIANTGDRLTTALRGVADGGYALEDYDRAVITKEQALETEAHEALPPGISRIVFERFTLLAGTTLLLEPANGQDWLGVTSGRLGLTLLGDGLPLNWQAGREREILPDEPLPALVPGTRVTLRNIGEEPLVLLRLRVLPAAIGERPANGVEQG
jgi:hypothetical protein